MAIGTVTLPPVEKARNALTQPAIGLAGQGAETSNRSLDEALVGVLDACTKGLGYLYPSILLLHVERDRLIGRPISSRRTCMLVRQGTASAGVPLDSFLGYSKEQCVSARRATGIASGPQNVISYRLCTTENLAARVFLERAPQVTRCYYDVVRPHLQVDAAVAAQQALGIGFIVLLPLLVAERCLGLLAVAAPPGRPIADSDLRVLEPFATHAAMAVENARLQLDLRDREQQVSLLLKATIDAQEEERERICMDIHDGLAQTLAAAFHSLQTLESQADFPDDSRAGMRKAGTLVRQAIREAREVIAGLRPAALDTLGLVATVRYELDELREQMGWTVDFEADRVRFPKAIETALYRIVHEALSNVAKHARAKHVAVRVKQEQGLIVAEVEDDGIGFDVVAVKRRVPGKGVGLLSMRKRAELLNGSFCVAGNPGEGTRIRVEVPLPAREGW